MGKIRDIVRMNDLDSEELVRPSLVNGYGFLPYHLDVQTNLAVKVSSFLCMYGWCMVYGVWHSY